MKNLKRSRSELSIGGGFIFSSFIDMDIQSFVGGGLKSEVIRLSNFSEKFDCLNYLFRILGHEF